MPLYVARKPLLLLVCALLLLCGGVLLVPRIAHAAGPMLLFPHLCADSPNTERCNGADPITEGCLSDARAVDTRLALHQGVVVGYVTLRASARCRTYWVKSIAYADSGVESTLTTISYGTGDPRFAPGASHSYPTSLLQPDGSIALYTDMAFRVQPPTIRESTFFLSDGTSVTVWV